MIMMALNKTSQAWVQHRRARINVATHRRTIAEATRTVGVAGIAEMRAVVAGVAAVDINGVVEETATATMGEEVVVVVAEANNSSSSTITGNLEMTPARHGAAIPTMMPQVDVMAGAGCTTHIEGFQRMHNHRVSTGRRLFDWR